MDLRTFLDQVRVKRRGDLVEIDREVSPRYETTAILTKLEERRRSPILYFKKVSGASWPVVTNVCGSLGRLALALDCPLRDLSKRWTQACENPIKPRVVASGLVQQNVLTESDVDLEILPGLVYHEHDSPRPYITGGVLVARDLDTGVTNLSFHRLMIAGRNRTGIFMEPGKHLDLIFRKYVERGKPMPVAVFIGCHPSWFMGALYSGSADVDEYDVIGGLLGSPLELVECVSVEGLAVPANAEIVLEGHVSTTETIAEGPFGEFTGYGTGITETPVLDISAMTFRDDPIFQDIASGHLEHLMLPMIALEHRATETLREVTPNVIGVSLSAPLSLVVALRKADDGEPARVIRHLLESDIYTKHVIVVEDDVDPGDLAAVFRAIALNVQADRDVLILTEQWGTPLDPSSPDAGGKTTKMGIDATLTMNPNRVITANSLPQAVLDAVDLTDILPPSRTGT